MDIAIHPVDRSRWADLKELFGPNGATRGCWCMARRRPSGGNAVGSAENQAALKKLVDNGMPVGVLGYLLDGPVAWCAVAPRSAYESIVRSRTLPIDDPGDETIWAVNCLFIKAGFRRQGLTLPMVEAAVGYARESGARVVEAYPVEILPGDTSRGTLGTFLDAGFSVYERERTTSKRNVVVRRPLRNDGENPRTGT